MGRKNRERVARIRAGHEEARATPLDPIAKARAGRCPFPGCTGRPVSGQSPHGFCAAHEKFVADLLFIIPRIQWQPAKPKRGLVLPGHPDFNVVPSAKEG